MTSTHDDFFSLLETTVALQASELLTATDSQLRESYVQRAAKKRRLPITENQPAEDLDWESVLTPCERGRLAAQREIAREADFDGPFFVDLNKVDSRTRPAKYIPVLTQKTVLWSEERRRLVLPAEYLGIMGFPVSSDMSIGVPLPWSEKLGADWPRSVSASELRSLTGNAMHMAVVGAVIGFTLASAQRVSRTCMFRSMCSALFTHADVDDDDSQAGAG